MASIGSIPRRSRRLLVEAARFRLLGLMLERPRPGWHDEIAALAREIEGDRRGRSDFAAAAGAVAGAREGDYLRLFGPGGIVSPREVSYRPLADPGRLLAELAEIYFRFAYRPKGEDPLDHVAIEAGFAGYLALKEGYALARGDRAAAKTTRGAAHLFLTTHLGGFAVRLARRLEDAGAGHLALAARLLEERIGRRIDLADAERSIAGPMIHAPGAGAEASDAIECGGSCPLPAPD